MRIGVVCEGRSDYPAIEKFLGRTLHLAGIEATFKPLYPQMDRTRPGAGWPNVLLWLKNNPPAVRVRKYFGGGLFGGGLEAEPFDAILLHLDADVVEHPSFINYVTGNFGIDIGSSETSDGRGQAIRTVLRAALEWDQLSESDQSRHVLAVAVESTETWCLAAFHAQPDDWEALRGPDLTNRFMIALERSESRIPKDEYAECDKDYKRRLKFCVKHADQANRISASCPQFSRADLERSLT